MANSNPNGLPRTDIGLLPKWKTEICRARIPPTGMLLNLYDTNISKDFWFQSTLYQANCPNDSNFKFLEKHKGKIIVWRYCRVIRRRQKLEGLQPMMEGNTLGETHISLFFPESTPQSHRNRARTEFRMDWGDRGWSSGLPGWLKIGGADI